MTPGDLRDQTGRVPQLRAVQSPLLKERWWTRYNPRRDPDCRLICFPYAGGNAAAFRTWPKYLPSTVELYGVQLPGRAERTGQPAYRDMAPLIADLGPQLATLLDRPFALFGHSMGAMLAFESARWLRRHGHPQPAHLFISGRRAPQVNNIDPPRHLKPDEEFIADLVKLNGTPEELLRNSELLALMLPTLRADFRVAECYEYRPEEPLDCPLTLFSGDADEEATAARLDGWRQQTRGRFEAHVMPGGHFFVHEREDELVAIVRRDLAGLPSVIDRAVDDDRAAAR